MSEKQVRYVLERYGSGWSLNPDNAVMFASLKGAKQSVSPDKVKWERVADDVWWGRSGTGRYRIYTVTYPSHESILHYLALREGQRLIDGEEA